jgi:hypothetical protein
MNKVCASIEISSVWKAHQWLQAGEYLGVHCLTFRHYELPASQYQASLVIVHHALRPRVCAIRL